MADQAELTTPANLLNARRLYKVSTSVVVDWLAKNGAANKKKAKDPTLTVNEILSHADRASKRKVTAPAYVQSAFRTALVNRRRITAWYRQNELGQGGETEETQKHEHFITTLDKAFTTLFPNASDTTSTSLNAKAPDNQDNLFANSFGPLENVSTDKLSSLSDAEVQAHLNSWAESTAKPEARISDDPLDEIFEFHRYVMEMDYMVGTIKGYWRLAANGTLPVPLVAWLTSAGYAGIKDICEVYQNAGGISHKDLCLRYLQKKSRTQLETKQDLTALELERSGYNPMYTRFSEGMALLAPSYALKDWKWNKQIQEDLLRDVYRVKPTDMVSSPYAEHMAQMQLQMQTMSMISDLWRVDLPEDEATRVLSLTKQHLEKDGDCYGSFIRSIIQIANENGSPGMDGFKLFGCPMMPETIEYLRGDFIDVSPEDLSSGKINEQNFLEHFKDARTEVIFGMTMLLETGKSFLWKDEKPNPVNLRLRALQFANEVKTQMKQLIDKEVESDIYRNMQQNTVYRLNYKYEQLVEFTKTTRFDLYYQMPWVAGAQISETLFMALESGIAVCRTRDIFGSMLHAYNLARQVAPRSTRPLPFMEQLCDLFLDQIFLGERPKRRFHTILLRAMGGGLESTKDKSKRGRGQRKEDFRIGAPKSLADGEEDNDRLKAHEFSVFHDLRSHEPPYHGGAEFYAKVFTNRRVKTITAKQRLAMEAQLHEVPFAMTLDRMKDIAMADFTGPFPVARINWFKVYELAVEALTDIARRYQRKMPSDMSVYGAQRFVQPAPADACAGSSFITPLFMDVEAHMERPRYKDCENHGGVKLVWDALEKCVGNKTAQDFLWENV